MSDMTLTEFLLARIAEGEAEYRDIAGDEAHQQYAIHECPDGNEGYIVSEALRMLRECAAKRAIVAKAQRAEGAFAQSINPASSAASFALAEVLQRLAAVYADHPDYREEWRP